MENNPFYLGNISFPLAACYQPPLCINPSNVLSTQMVNPNNGRTSSYVRPHSNDKPEPINECYKTIPNNNFGQPNRINSVNPVFPKVKNELKKKPLIKKNKFNSYIKFILFRNTMDKYISNDVYEVFYINDHFNGPKKEGKTRIELDIEEVRKWCPSIAILNVGYCNSNDKVDYHDPPIEINGDKLDLWVETDGKIIVLTFIEFSSMDKNNEKLRIKIRLNYGKKNQRNRGKQDKNPKKGHYIKKSKSEIIESVLVILKKNHWDLFDRCPMNLSELGTDPKFQKEIRKLTKKLKENEITNTEQNMKDIINVIERTDKEKNNLVILCFDIIYKRVILYLQDNTDEGMTGYLRLFKHYNTGNDKNNDIIILDEVKEDDKDQKDDQCKKRKFPEENSEAKRQRMNVSSGNSSRQIDKISDVEVLLVDH